MIDYVTGCFADVIEKVVAVAWKSVDEAVGGVKKSEDFGDQPTQSGYLQDTDNTSWIICTIYDQLRCSIRDGRASCADTQG